MEASCNSERGGIEKNARKRVAWGVWGGVKTGIAEW